MGEVRVCPRCHERKRTYPAPLIFIGAAIVVALLFFGGRYIIPAFETDLALAIFVVLEVGIFVLAIAMRRWRWCGICYSPWNPQAPRLHSDIPKSKSREWDKRRKELDRQRSGKKK